MRISINFPHLAPNSLVDLCCDLLIKNPKYFANKMPRLPFDLKEKIWEKIVKNPSVFIDDKYESSYMP